MTALRIIDANANRAREAIRVAEDIARFTLCRTDLAGDLKSLRHDLVSAIGALGIDQAEMLAHRDTPTDVGTSLSTPTERSRDNLASVAAAAMGRLSESLRAIEELSKTLGPGSEHIEALRYRAYDIDSRLRRALAGTTARQWKLCVLISESLCTHHPWTSVINLAIEGGADCIQLREKDLPDRELLRRATWLADCAKESGVTSVINDRTDIALAAGADAVHVGQDDLAPAQVRSLCGSRLLIGVSTSTLDQARAAVADGADSVGLGPMYPSSTKPKDVIAGPAYLRSYLEAPDLARVPHLAIGGIDHKRAGELAAMGCQGVAVSSAVCGAAHPAIAAAELLAAISATST